MRLPVDVAAMMFGRDEVKNLGDVDKKLIVKPLRRGEWHDIIMAQRDSTE